MEGDSVALYLLPKLLELDPEDKGADPDRFNSSIARPSKPSKRVPANYLVQSPAENAMTCSACAYFPGNA